jgi:predicted RNase H-like nuclease (RuvC/YqgF family)
LKNKNKEYNVDMSEEYIKQLEETIERMKVEMENLHVENEEIKEKWRTHEIFDESEMWSLDDTIAKFVYPRLVELKKVKHGYPSELKDEHEWVAIMDKMIRAFEIMHNDEYYPSVAYDKKTQGEIDEGLKLFAKYFQNLWD